MPCRHCGRENVNRPRQLCWPCYYSPGVRALYPSTSKFGNRGVGNTSAGYTLPAGPTKALPGSPEKIAVLIERARLGQCLWHPADAGVIYTAEDDDAEVLHRLAG